MPFKHKIHAAFYGSHTGNASLTLQLAIASLIILNVIAVLLETVEQIGTAYGNVFNAFEWFSVSIFGVEYLARVWVSNLTPQYQSPIRGRLRYILSPMALIDTEIARRGHGFGMRVIATRRGTDPAPDFVERVGRPQDLLTLLPQADVVAIAVPLTAETTGLFDRAAFAAMKRGSFLINIARGKVVENSALIDALQSGHLAGACLDVTDPEPLPPESPLWKFPNVVITPHVAAQAELTDSRAWLVFRENLRRFDAGEPLLNVVDRKAGY